jgi:hypothetical protein
MSVLAAERHVAEISLSQAALRLRRPYRTTLDMLFTGRLKGRQDPLNGRWLVEEESLERLCLPEHA